MRKFKLIKTYPGSLELGAIRKDFDNPILSKYFTDYPEFWEEVIEPDFEILAFKQDSGITDLWTYFPGAGWSRNVNGHPATAPYTIEILLKHNMYKIHSVKRLSDGEIFTVGDRAKTITSKGSHNIRQFRINQKCIGGNSIVGWQYDGVDRIWIDWEEDRGGNWLESTEKVTPLFITQDGVDIFAGDTYWCVNTAPHLWSLWEQTSKKTTQLNKGVLAFSTKQIAQDYVENNKPRFSIMDCYKITAEWHLNSSHLEEIIKRYIKENNK